MNSESNGAQDPAVPPAAEATAGKVTSSAMQLFAPDPNAGGESVSPRCHDNSFSFSSKS
jgi:hypothetical protein